MIFYHYTTRGAIASILVEGLTREEAPISPTRVAKAINLTTDSNPAGHGLDHGGHVATQEVAAKHAMIGFVIPAGTVYANKLEARITVKLPSSDLKLKSWRSWSRKHCEPGYAEQLELAVGQNGRKAKTWRLYLAGSLPRQ